MAPRKAKQKAAAVAYPGRRGGEFPLCEKYAPRSVGELVLWPKTTQRVREWITARVQQKEEGKLLVLGGRPGIGKSTLVETLGKELSFDVIRWRNVHGLGGDGWADGDYESHIKQFKEFLRGAMTPTLGGKPSLLLVDETPDIKYCGDELRSALDQVAQNALRPVVLIVSDGILEKSDTRIVVDAVLGDELAASRFVDIVEVNPVTELKIKGRLEAIARAERTKTNVPVSDDDVAAIAADADGDLRAALNALEILLTRRDDADDDDDDDFFAMSKKRRRQNDGGGKKKKHKKDTDDAHRQSGDATSDIHAVGRLMHAKRSESDPSKLSFDPDRTVRNMKMSPDAAACFLQFNCVAFFGTEIDLVESLDDLSAADLFVARCFSTHLQRDGSDPIYPEAYIGTIVGRTVAARNRHPAPPAFRGVQKPRVYDLIADLAKFRKLRFRGLLGDERRRLAPVDLDAPPTIRRTFFDLPTEFPTTQDDDDPNADDDGLLPEDDIVEFD